MTTQTLRRRISPLLLAMHDRIGRRPITIDELAELVGCVRDQAPNYASTLVRWGYLERADRRGVYWIAPEAIPAALPPAPPPPKPKAPKRPPKRPEMEPPDLTGRVFASDHAVLDALDAADGPMTAADLRRALGVQSTVGHSLRRLEAAGLVRREGAAWLPT